MQGVVNLLLDALRFLLAAALREDVDDDLVFLPQLGRGVELAGVTLTDDDIGEVRVLRNVVIDLDRGKCGRQGVVDRGLKLLLRVAAHGLALAAAFCNSRHAAALMFLKFSERACSIAGRRKGRGA